jgi:DNA-binding HxlR family transcriptional regulator
MPRAPVSDAPTARDLLVHETLARIADKWTLVAIDALDEGGTLRFGELRRRMGPVSQKVLTRTLRQLERDGLVRRTAYAEVPPRVEYRLTPLGRALGQAVCGVWTWAARHLADVARAREAYDAARAPVPAVARPAREGGPSRRATLAAAARR